METFLRKIAECGEWTVVLDANSVVSIRRGHGEWICDHASAYDAIVGEVKDPLIRAELLKQWGRYMNGGNHNG